MSPSTRTHRAPADQADRTNGGRLSISRGLDAFLLKGREGVLGRPRQRQAPRRQQGPEAEKGEVVESLIVSAAHVVG
jgi:hypothetical protein